MNNFEQDAPLRDELQQIVENLNFILENTKNISPIEKDIILQHLRDAYLSVMKLSTANIVDPAPTVEPAPVAPSEPVVEQEPYIKPEPVVEQEPYIKPEPVFETAFGPEPIEPEPVVEPVTFAEPEPAVEPEPVVEPEPMTEPEPVVEPEPVIEPKLVVEPEPMMEPEPIVEPEPEDDILDFLSKPVESPKEQPRPVQPQVTPQPVRPAQQPTLFSEEPATPSKPEPRRSLNDVLMEQKEDNSIASSFQNRKVQDLAKSININDKFLFIKELFRGKGEEFGMAIQKLNRCNSLEEAFNEIDIMKKFYFWDTSAPAYLALCDLVRRKFI